MVSCSILLYLIVSCCILLYLVLDLFHRISFENHFVCDWHVDKGYPFLTALELWKVSKSL
jgi:hypothetical protein